VVITPTLVAGGQPTLAPPTYAEDTPSSGPTLALPARSDPGFGSLAPTQPPTPATAPPGPTPTPTSLPPTSTPDPRAPRARKLTADDCCPEPRWLPDGASVAYFGAGGTAGAAGTWAIPRGGGAAQLLTARYGILSPDGQMIAYPEGAIAHIARLDGTVLASWETNGRVYFAPQGGRVAWFDPAGDVAAASISLDPPVRVAIGTIATGAAATLPPSFSAERLQWFPDGKRILISGREGNGNNPGLWVLDVATGAATRNASGKGLENVAISPDGRQIAYTATLQDDRAADGLWLIDADGGNRRKLPFTGGYRWSPDSAALYYVPLSPNLPSDQLWRYLLADGSTAAIVTAAQVPFRIMQDQWELAPTGDAIVYRSAANGAIWVISWLK
jgi:Tol biopolymer transport system component